jgi:hypothetical protein
LPVVGEHVEGDDPGRGREAGVADPRAGRDARDEGAVAAPVAGRVGRDAGEVDLGQDAAGQVEPGRVDAAVDDRDRRRRQPGPRLGRIVDVRPHLLVRETATFIATSGVITPIEASASSSFSCAPVYSPERPLMTPKRFSSPLALPGRSAATRLAFASTAVALVARAPWITTE